MVMAYPEVKYPYQNHHLDNTRWNHFVPRHDDIIIATALRSGTTWMQLIVMNLIFQDRVIRTLNDISPWLEARFYPLDEVLRLLESQTHRRFVKTHLPLDGLRFFPDVKYIVVARDARDVCMSLWKHYSSYSADIYYAVNETPGRMGDLFPACPQSLHDFWQKWITRGWFPWETEGYPFWGNLHHTQSWWDYRHLPNILLVHFNDLLQDIEGQIRRVADYLAIELTEETLSSIVAATAFAHVKQNAGQIVPDYDTAFIGGAQSFINKGTNGRWCGVLTDEELALYEAAMARELTPDCADWLQHGFMKNASG